MDDDNYVNVGTLLKFLSRYPHTQDVYVGKPSLDRPIEATERLGDNKMVRRRLSVRLLVVGNRNALTTFVCVCVSPSRKR